MTSEIAFYKDNLYPKLLKARKYCLRLKIMRL